MPADSPNLDKYFFPGELERAIATFVEYYNNERLHESLNNVTPADVYFGRQREILTRREMIKRRTFKQRKRENLKGKLSESTTRHTPKPSITESQKVSGTL